MKLNYYYLQFISKETEIETVYILNSYSSGLIPLHFFCTAYLLRVVSEVHEKCPIHMVEPWRITMSVQRNPKLVEYIIVF